MLKLYLEQSFDDMETYRLAETTDLFYRRLRNQGIARRHAEYLLADEHTAMQAAATKIIKMVPVGMHPVNVINQRNLAVVRAVTMSRKRAVLLGSEGRVYAAYRGRVMLDGKFEPTADTLNDNFMLVQGLRDNRVIKRVTTLRPTHGYIN